MREKRVMSDALLAWYDVNARDMPWRTSPQDRAKGVMPDPYAVWLSEVMLQQTTVAAVRDYFTRFLSLWPRVDDLARAKDAQVMGEWAGLGYYARARNLLKCARVVSTEFDGVFPNTAHELQKLPGIGPYTSAAIAAIAFDRVETVVDGNVERVMARIFAEIDPIPAGKDKLRLRADAMTPHKRCGDYAQAVMDLGATVCTPKSPTCGICPWRADCEGRAQGIEATLPRRTPKKPKPVRRGTVFVGRRQDGAWLVETRPEKGLLGGMLGWPGNIWAETPEQPTSPMPGTWILAPGEVRHTFTHFHLILDVMVCDVLEETGSNQAKFIQNLRPSDLPTVMRKALDLAQSAME